MLKDTVMENYDMSMSRTAKVYDCLERACYEFDLEKPMWLDKNKREFISHARTRFYQDNFIEHIDFDYLDFHYHCCCHLLSFQLKYCNLL